MRPFTFWSPPTRPDPAERPKLTLISGFLGAGKTTLLNELLQRNTIEKVAVLVNDLGSVNVDAALVRHAVQRMEGAIGGVMELTSGCICCSIRNELMDAVVELMETYAPTHIIIEATGVAEPRAVIETLNAGNLLGIRGVDVLRVANLITVVDAANIQPWLQPMIEAGELDRKRIHLHQVDRRRPLEELAMEQIEVADVLVISKTDAVDAEALSRIEAALVSLNPHAELFHSQFGRLDAEALFGKDRYDPVATHTAARWHQELAQQPPLALPKPAPRGSIFQFGPAPAASGHGKPDPMQTYGLASFVYHARRPMEGRALLELLRGGLKNVVRAKGFYWTTEHPDRVGFLSIAGKILRADYMDHWWIDRLRCGQITREEIPDGILKIWVDEDIGDRRQELVFIGVDMDADTIRRQLDDCLCR
jgi:G3E family GTPase